MKKSLLFFSKIDGQKEVDNKFEKRFGEAKKYFLKHLKCKGELKVVEEHFMADGLSFTIHREHFAVLLSIKIALMDDGGIIVDSFKTMKLTIEKEEEKLYRFWTDNEKGLVKEISKLNGLLKNF